MNSLLDLVQADSTLRKAGASKWHGPCPKCGGDDRFTVSPDKGENGFWFCFGCNIGGDAIKYEMVFHGRTFLEACELVGKDPGERKPGRRQPRPREQRPAALAARQTVAPVDAWQAAAGDLVTFAEHHLHGPAGAAARDLLAARGLAGDLVHKYRLGYIPADRFPSREAWGLPDVLRDDGKPKKLLVPAGIVIPCLDEAGNVVRVRVRRDKVEEGQARYYTMPGSDTRAMVTGAGLAAVVVESDLDVLLLEAVAGDLVRCVSTGSAQTRPDFAAATILNAAPLVLVALDTDDAGAKAFWSKWQVPNTNRWPIPPKYGKDPGDAYRAGLDLRAWVELGLERACISTAPVAAWSKSRETTRCEDVPTSVGESTALVKSRQPETMPVPLVRQSGACPCCGGASFWSSQWVASICRVCHPPTPGAEVAA